MKFKRGDLVQPKIPWYNIEPQNSYIYVAEADFPQFCGVYLGKRNSSLPYNFDSNAYKLVTSILREKE